MSVDTTPVAAQPADEQGHHQAEHDSDHEEIEAGNGLDRLGVSA
jgi:hypothetical protein